MSVTPIFETDNGLMDSLKLRASAWLSTISVEDFESASHDSELGRQIDIALTLESPSLTPAFFTCLMSHADITFLTELPN